MIDLIKEHLIKIPKIEKIQRHPKYGYVVLTYYTGSEFGSEPFLMSSAFSTPEYHYLGDAKTAKFICKKMGLKPHMQTEEEEERARYILNMDWDEKAKLMLSGFEKIFLANPASIGWSEKEQKWYGWSHRAIYGFGVGEEMTRDCCGYEPVDKEDYARWILDFFCDGGDDKHYKDIKIEQDADGDGTKGIYLSYNYTREDGSTYDHHGFHPYPVWGKGVWTAKTIEDAKEMAISFAKRVS